MLKIDWNKYVGIPWKQGGRSFEGADCWGLLLLFYYNEFKIEINDYDSFFYDGDLDRIYDSGVEHGEYDNWIKLEKPQPGAGILFRCLNYPIHVGICVNNRKFLHIERSKNSVIVDNWKWRNRIEGYYIHHSLL